MKKPLFLIFLIPLIGFCDEFKLNDLNQGMYSNQSANKIPDNSATYIANFVTDVEPMAIERNGYVKRDTTILGGTKPVYGLWDFTDSSGNNWIISYSSRTYYKNTIGTTPTAFGPTTTTDQIPDCAKNLGKIMCVNGTDTAWSFDGTSTANVSGAPLGTLIEPWRTRFVISNITGAKSTGRVSADGLETSWTLGPLATDPFAFQIGGANDGEYVRCLVGSYLDSMIIGRRNDLWALDGFDQSDYNVRNISNQIGCIESRSPQEVDGELVFLSARGLEAMNGRSIRQISDPIRNITDVIVRNTVNQRSNTQTLAADWGAGSSDNSVYVDTQTSSGDVQLTFPDLFDSFRDGTVGTKSVWTSYCQALTACTTNVAVSNGILNLNTVIGVAGEDQMFRSQNRINNYKQGTTFYFSISTITTASNTVFQFGISSASLNQVISSVFFNDYFYFGFKSTTTGTIYLSQVKDSIDGSICLSNCQTGNSVFPSTVSIFIATTTYQISINGIVIKSGSHGYTNNPVFMYSDFFYGNSGNGIMGIDSFDMKPETVTYTSQLLNIGSLITSWGPMTISDSKTNSNITYQFGSTSTASLSSVVNYQTATNGYVPTIATNPYAAFKASFINSQLLATSKLSEYVTTWNEGGIVPSPVSFIYDRRYWLSYTTTTASSPALDSILIWQRNKSFVLFKGINAGSFAYWRDNLYFGNSNSTGYVYKFDTGNNDDGSDINSSIITKSYDLGQFFRDKEFSKSYIGYLGGSSQSGSFSLGYDLNRYGTIYSLGSVSLSEEQGQGAAKMWFPLNQLVRGREIQFTLSKSGTGSRLKFYDLATEFELKEEK